MEHGRASGNATRATTNAPWATSSKSPLALASYETR